MSFDSLYSFLNHSCELEEMLVSIDRDFSGKEMYAERDIKKGEEVLINYLPPVNRVKNTQGRWNALSPRFAPPCKCTRCERLD